MEKQIHQTAPAAKLREFVIITVAMFVTALSVHCFMEPAHLAIGSVAGLAILIQTLTGIPVSVLTLVINIVLLVISYVLIDHDFGLKTIYTTLILSPFLYLMEKVMPIRESLNQDPFVDMICFCLVFGLAQAILFHSNASSGGLDIIAKIFNKYLDWQLSSTIMVIGILIAASSVLVYDFRTMILGVLGTFIDGIILDYFLIGFDNRKRICIISDRYQELQEFIVKDLDRGATLYPVIGGSTNENHIEIETIMTKQEFSALKAYIDRNRINCFMTAGNVHEIYGNWADHSRRKRRLK